MDVPRILVVVDPTPASERSWLGGSFDSDQYREAIEVVGESEALQRFDSSIGLVIVDVWRERIIPSTRLIEELRATPHGDFVPILALIPREKLDTFVEEIVGAGADDFMILEPGGFNFKEFDNRIVMAIIKASKRRRLS